VQGSRLMRPPRNFPKPSPYSRILPIKTPFGCDSVAAEANREALELLKSAAQLSPQSSQAHYYLGRVLEERGQSGEAIHELQAQFGYSRTRSRPKPNLDCFAADGTHRARPLLFAAWLSRNPTTRRPQQSGLALIQAGQANDSIPEFEAALRFRPDDAGYRTNLGTAYLQKTDFDGAIAQFQSALKTAPQDATLHYDLGLALKLKDQLVEALEEFRKAEALDPTQPDIHYTLGVTLRQSGRLTRAQYFSASIQLPRCRSVTPRV